MRDSIIIVALIVVILISCVFSYRAMHQPVSKRQGSRAISPQSISAIRTEVASGINYLLELRKESRLPGITTNEHGNATCNAAPVSYPYSMTVCFIKTGETARNNYTIEQFTNNADWHLKRAWQTDSKGQVVQDWPVN